VVAGAGVPSASLFAAEWKALGALVHSGARVTASAVDLQTGATIQALDPRQRLSPASLTKLAVTAAALKAWPADKTFETRVLVRGTVKNGVLNGDLILQGAGDPSLEFQSMWVLASQIKGAGIDSVKGKLVVVPAPFSAVGCETEDRCKAFDRSDTAYNAPLASIGVDYGNWCIDARPTEPGSAAQLRGCGVAHLPIAVDGEIHTVGSGEKQTFWIERVTTADGDALRVGGNLPAGEGQHVYRAMSNPAYGVGQLLKETLHEIGIDVSGTVSLEGDPIASSAYVVAHAEGLSLREQLSRMLRFSNNYIADVLTLDLAAALDPKPPTQLSAASHTLSDFIGSLPQIGGNRDSSPPLFSGSGLTPENQLSADDLVRILANQYHDTRSFSPFYGGLVVPRQAPFAFLRQGSPAWLDRVALKTGTMDEPYSVCGIAGYLRKKDGGWIAFAAVVNGGPGFKHVPLYKAMEAARGDVEDVLAHY
jgi:D-alanyl-D-alanine carboxypeptidase/D-alanyl-D-alanine-endopeptidase (penicillin-binding protein 4)